LLNNWVTTTSGTNSQQIIHNNLYSLLQLPDTVLQVVSQRVTIMNDFGTKGSDTA